MISLNAKNYFPVSPGAFRIFLALLVFLHHCSRFALGEYAVYVFFVLSGFWVDSMWTEKYRRTRNPLLTYTLSRAWRLLPTFIIAGIIVISFELAMGISKSAMLSDDRYRLIFSSIFILGYSHLDYLPVYPAWSLDIEVQFYALAPLLSFVMRRSGIVMPMAILSAVSIASALLVAKPALTSYIFFFGIGMALSAVRWHPSAKLAVASAAVLMVTVAAIAISPLRGALLGGVTPSPLFVWNPLLNIVEAIITIPFAIYTTRQRSDGRDRMMADLSYIIYLLHWPVALWLPVVGGSALHRLPYFALGGVVVIGGSWILWRFYDLPINRLRSRWVAGRTHTSALVNAREVAAP
jgi:peptidoglycan/LPS O-acetylase OafA/YrhL